MTLKCSCGGTEKLIKESGSSLYDIAYDDIIEWSDFNSIQEVPDINEEGWERSDRIPRAGTKRIVRACFPFNFETGDTFHVLFMPALSFFNGWDSYPEEIAQSAVVQCKFDEVISYNGKYAWIIIHIIKVTPLDKLHETYPREIKDKLNFEYRLVTHFEYGNWSIYYDSCDDWGNKYLFFTDSNMEKHMILACQWDYHVSKIKCCNTVFKADIDIS